MSFLWNWFVDRLRSYGFVNINARMLFLGLDNAGKTTLLHMMRDNRLVQHAPTHHPTTEEFSLPTGTMGQRINFTTYDLGGHKEARAMWSTYHSVVDAIFYLVDVSDCARLLEAKTELDKLLMDPDIPEDVPIAVLGNKVDAEGALSEAHFRDLFGLVQTTGKHQRGHHLPSESRIIEVFMCSIKNREGYGEALKWVAQFI
jgi:GTP-binding protein SAR1